MTQTPRTFAKTLPGLGPVITERHARATRDISSMERELQRYLWLRRELTDVIHERSLVEWFEIIRMEGPRAPGQLEAALVALSLHADDLAGVALSWFTPPEDLRGLHAICQTRRAELRDAFRSPSEHRVDRQDP